MDSSAKAEHTLPTNGEAADAASPRTTAYTEQEVLEDWRDAFKLLESGHLDRYGGQHVVIFKGKVIASGENSSRLREDAARRLSVAPSQVVVKFVDNMDAIVLE